MSEQEGAPLELTELEFRYIITAISREISRLQRTADEAASQGDRESAAHYRRLSGKYDIARRKIAALAPDLT